MFCAEGVACPDGRGGGVGGTNVSGGSFCLLISELYVSCYRVELCSGGSGEGGGGSSASLPRNLLWPREA